MPFAAIQLPLSPAWGFEASLRLVGGAPRSVRKKMQKNGDSVRMEPKQGFRSIAARRERTLLSEVLLLARFIKFFHFFAICAAKLEAK